MTVRVTSASIAWDAVPSATGYVVERNGKAVTSTKNALVAKNMTLASGDTIAVVAKPSGQLQQTVVSWLAPAPPGVIPGIGLIRLGGTLAQATHQSSYSFVVADWDDQATLATLPGQTFAYQNLGPGGYNPLNLGDPAALIALAATLPQGVGLCLDNCNANTAATQLPFLKAVCPPILASGRKIYANASGYGAPGDGNNGDADIAWFAQLAGLFTHLASPWQQADVNDVLTLRLRGTEWYENWDGWQRLPAAAHAAGAVYVCGLNGGTVGVSNGVYGRASLLVAAGAQPTDIFVYAPGSDGSAGDPWDPAWTIDDPAATVDPVNGTATLTAPA